MFAFPIYNRNPIYLENWNRSQLDLRKCSVVDIRMGFPISIAIRYPYLGQVWVIWSEST